MRRHCVPALLVLAGGLSIGIAQAAGLSSIESLGRSIFFDKNLSINRNQSCAVCHGPEAGWTGPLSALNATGSVYEGSIPGRFGNRKPPSSAYATQSPILHVVQKNVKKEALFIGGNFWDGRATGERLGSPAADQAQGPFLNPLEQALPDSACVVHRVCSAAGYPVSFADVWGADACAISWPADIDSVCATEGATVSLSSADRGRVNENYDRIASSIAAFEASAESNAFTSKFDYAHRGMAKLSAEEQKGFSLFMGKAKCAGCHVLTPAAKGGALFTDFTFDNLGLPRNPQNPFYGQTGFNQSGADWIDAGLGGFLTSRQDYARFASENWGKQKVPTLRNVGLRPSPDFVKAFGHNGYFKTLKGIIHFYNTRDVKPACPSHDDGSGYIEAEALAAGCWPLPEVPMNVNRAELGDLGLSSAEEDALVAFLEALSDGYLP
jgi:cytochrome c peroxidase